MTDAVETLRTEHAAEAARLHREGIPTGFLSSLGQAFLTALYEALAESERAFGFVALQEGRVCGFVAFCDNLDDLYRSVLRRHAVRFAGLLAGRLFSLSCLRRIWQTLRYPARTRDADLPAAELLAVVIEPRMRGHGVAEQLIRRGLAQCRRRQIPAVKVLVAADNAPANRLYQKCGFSLVERRDSHAIPSHIYVARLVSPDGQIG
ncbi:MAG: GNAT family N-acetyltransferase [Sedimentisphaerales bacterium]|nr:GNAT family N-acetyltransferase [Sedimentisphaerales bacterium]